MYLASCTVVSGSTICAEQYQKSRQHMSLVQDQETALLPPQQMPPAYTGWSGRRRFMLTLSRLPDHRAASVLASDGVCCRSIWTLCSNVVDECSTWALGTRRTCVHMALLHVTHTGSSPLPLQQPGILQQRQGQQHPECLVQALHTSCTPQLGLHQGLTAHNLP